jgi:hypothetical protein
MTTHKWRKPYTNNEVLWHCDLCGEKYEGDSPPEAHCPRATDGIDGIEVDLAKTQTVNVATGEIKGPHDWEDDLDEPYYRCRVCGAISIVKNTRHDCVVRKGFTVNGGGALSITPREGSEIVTDDPKMSSVELPSVLFPGHHTQAPSDSKGKAQPVKCSQPGLRKKVYVCHAYSNDPESNIIKVALIARKLVEKGFWPIAPQLYLGQFINEKADRKLAMEFCIDLMTICDQVLVCGDQLEPEMKEELNYALRKGITVRFDDKGEFNA